MSAKQRQKRRYMVNVRLMNGPYIIALGRMTANQAVSFKADPWQIFKREVI